MSAELARDLAGLCVPGPFKWERRRALINKKPTGPESLVILDGNGAIVATLAPGEWAHRTAAAIVAAMNFGRTSIEREATVAAICDALSVDDLDDLEANAQDLASRPSVDDWRDANDEIRSLKTELSDAKKSAEETEEQRARLERDLEDALTELDAQRSRVEWMRSALDRARQAVEEAVRGAA